MMGSTRAPDVMLLKWEEIHSTGAVATGCESNDRRVAPNTCMVCCCGDRSAGPNLTRSGACTLGTPARLKSRSAHFPLWAQTCRAWHARDRAGRDAHHQGRWHGVSPWAMGRVNHSAGQARRGGRDRSRTT